MSIIPVEYETKKSVKMDRKEMSETERREQSTTAQRPVLSREDQAIVDELMETYAPVWETLSKA